MSAAFTTPILLTSQLRLTCERTLSTRAVCRIISPEPVARTRSTPCAKQTSSETTSRREKIVGGPYKGQFGSWYLRQGDVDGVNTYRLCLLLSALSAATGTGLALTEGNTVPATVYDGLALASSLAFGGALQTIHIYAKPLHQLLKILWLAGFVGAVALATSPLTEHSVVPAVIDHPALLLAVGWQLVALTGLFVKEFFCFHRTEASLLIALVPLLSGGHFFQILPLSLERPGTAVFAALFVFFALRKFSQPATDDIGDMSVFDHLEKNGSV